LGECHFLPIGFEMQKRKKKFDAHSSGHSRAINHHYFYYGDADSAQKQDMHEAALAKQDKYEPYRQQNPA